MNEKIVTTVNNEELPISKTRLFENKYYKIGDNSIENSGDCYCINGKYYRFEKGGVVYDNTSKSYILKNSSILYGLIEDNQMGHFQNSNNVLIAENADGYPVHAVSEDVLIKNKAFREELSTGGYYHISRKTTRQFLEIRRPAQEYKTSLPYDSKGRLDYHIQRYNELYNSEILDAPTKIGGLLKDYTFGFEFETTKGFIPKRINDKLGLIPLRDGSISGIEYVTIPLQGAKGVQTLSDVTKVLKDRTVYDDSCALHMHIGNVPRTKEFILAFFKLTAYIQDDIFDLFPLYKKYNFRIKNKNYSKPYPVFDLMSKMDSSITSVNLDKNFNVLFEYLTEGVSFSSYGCDLNNVNTHPSDEGGNQKWNIKRRYHIHNLIPLIFGNKTTIEFRIHTPTYDISKISMFLLLNTILIDYAAQNTNLILQTNVLSSKHSDDKLVSIIKDYCDRSGIVFKHSMYSSLCAYIIERKQETCTLSREKGVMFNEDDYRDLPPYINWKKPVFVAQSTDTSSMVNSIIASYPSEVLTDFGLDSFFAQQAADTQAETIAAVAAQIGAIVNSNHDIF